MASAGVGGMQMMEEDGLQIWGLDVRWSWRWSWRRIGSVCMYKIAKFR